MRSGETLPRGCGSRCPDSAKFLDHQEALEINSTRFFCNRSGATIALAIPVSSSRLMTSFPWRSRTLACDHASPTRIRRPLGIARDRKRDRSTFSSFLRADIAWDEADRQPVARKSPLSALRRSWRRAEILHSFPEAHPIRTGQRTARSTCHNASRGDVFH